MPRAPRRDHLRELAILCARDAAGIVHDQAKQQSIGTRGNFKTWEILKHLHAFKAHVAAHQPERVNQLAAVWVDAAQARLIGLQMNELDRLAEEA